MDGVEGDEFCRIVESQFTPFIGKEFVDLEEVVELYKMYALACGFDVRRYTTKKWRDGTVKSKLLVCNRQGFTYAKKVNKELVLADSATTEIGEPCVVDKPRRKSKVRRIGCNARLRYSMVFTPFTGVDNHRRSVTFCGAILFRENEESFTWLFRRFLDAMGGKEPLYLITDQDPGIIASVANVFKTARHRFCMWHIMNKEFQRKLNGIVWDEELEAHEFDGRWSEIMEEHAVGPEREWFQEVFKIRRQWVMAHCRDLSMGSVLRTTQRSESENNFFKKFENNCGTLVEFWMRFESAVDQQRHTQKKLDNENRHSSPKLLTQLPIEIHGVRVYTREMFEEFQREVISSTTGLSARGFSEENGVEITNLKDGPRGKVFDIKFRPGTYEVTCTCRHFERCGMLCRHIISIFCSNSVKSMPECYVARRWCKDALGKSHENEDVIDGRQIQLTNLWSEVYETVGLLKGRGEEDIGYLCNLIRKFRVKLDPQSAALTKEQEIEQLLGCNPIDEIRILPPKHAKNKGSGKRMLSSKTVAVAKAAKSKRMSNNCKQMAHHDKRNCPNPFAQFPPPQPESSSEADDIDEEEEEDDESE
ncbi:hypothetical protein RND81_10G020000 [Saponaria officinalis]|uniref:SWIM-type domain-containing protein n=1 Tax=Saponaria officinalis TaxID=3572 RepID=A0AAW1HZU5_SAPOF